MKTKKTILLFIDWYLPGFKAGGPIQSCANLVDHLKNTYNFKIITRNTDYCETLPYPDVRSNEWLILDESTQIYYLSSDNTNKKYIFNLIQNSSFDMVYLNGVFSYYFTIVPLLYFRKNKAKKVIIAARGMLAKGALAIKGRKKRVFLTFSKILKLFHGVMFHATNEAEKQDIINAIGNKNQIKIAGNLSKKITMPPYFQKFKPKETLNLVNIARIAPEKNLKFALEILKDVKAKVNFDFYGPIYNENYYNACLSMINDLPQNIKVTYKNVVPNTQVYETLQKYDALFMPTLGENFGHIILESFIAACPVIISDKTPWQGLEEEKTGWSIPLTNKIKFIEVIEFLAKSDENLYKDFSLAAYQKAKNFVENEALLKANKELFD
ncbi:MAG TPA: glycosyltransferase [Bacteroidia bacterium]|nr:glycosyltransferase [Bacteroidia bacterium]